MGAVAAVHSLGPCLGEAVSCCSACDLLQIKASALSLSQSVIAAEWLFGEMGQVVK